LTPLPEYNARLAARTAAHSRILDTDARISYGRLAVVALFVIAVALTINGTVSALWLLVLVTAFLALAVWHDRVIQTRDRLARAIAFYEGGTARIEDRWHGRGEAGARFLDETHLYADDLDIFGRASLFQLLSQARTNAGEEELARWLKAPADRDAILQRQDAVAGLRGNLDFRESLATSGGSSRDIDTVALGGWAAAPLMPRAPGLRAGAIALSAAIIATLAWWALGGPSAPLVAVIALKMVLTRPSRARVAQVVRGVEAPLRDLDVIVGLLRLIETEEIDSTRLREIRAGIAIDGRRASDAIRRLRGLAEMLEWRRNAIFAPISATLSWPLHIAYAIEDWRRRFGQAVPLWVAAVAEYEALSSLATYAYEHPDDPFPVLVDEGPARFEAEHMGHPLVPADRMVRNDLRLNGEVRLLVVSGSNMSGKSTLLRTVGINAVLAMAGAPVRARRLALTRLAIGATLHVHDSLQEGRSRFFAEISRIRAIADLIDREARVLFLFDELFQGTNSHDRRIGAGALLTTLTSRGAVGLVTTHDLALTAVADTSGGRIVNVHFEDQLGDGQLSFDYRIKAGPVTHSNALALMKAVGLPVDEP
jgi:hypothetical protein